VPVTVVAVQHAPIRRLTRVQGSIEAIETPEIHSQVAAEVLEVLVDEGDRVTAGQVLARLDDAGFRLDQQAAEADIARMQALLDNQQRTLRRDRSLTEQQLVSAAKLDDSRAAVEQTRAQLAHARSLRAKTLYQLSHTRVVAPIAGVVQRRAVSRGDYLNPSSPNSQALFQIVNTDRLRARLHFPENLAGRITPGMPLELSRDGVRITSRISHLRPMLETGTRALQALAEFANTPGWKPGASVRARVILEQRDSALVVPEGVLVQRPAGRVVYRLEGDLAREVPVTPGIREGSRVELTAGVAAGDRLVLDGAGYLSDGVRVTVTEAAP
jgi:RND family efflux transporter MFP subunit